MPSVLAQAPVTVALIAVNVIAYFYEFATGALNSTRALVDDGALYGPLVVEDHQWWRIVTGAFLHGGLLHISFNMIVLYQLGTISEAIFGRIRTAVIYAFALVGGGLAVLWVNFNEPTVGASGAIFGLAGALGIAALRLGAVGRQLAQQTAVFVVLNVVLGFLLPNISIAGHIGGLITGAVLGAVLFVPPRRIAVAPAAAMEDAVNEHQSEELTTSEEAAP